jgi:hypothetical protein
MVVFSFFVRGQLANSTGITQTVNRFSAISLALMMPTGFPAEIRAKPQKSFRVRPGRVKISRLGVKFTRRWKSYSQKMVCGSRFRVQD